MWSQNPPHAYHPPVWSAHDPNALGPPVNAPVLPHVPLKRSFSGRHPPVGGPPLGSPALQRDSIFSPKLHAAPGLAEQRPSLPPLPGSRISSPLASSSARTPVSVGPSHSPASSHKGYRGHDIRHSPAGSIIHYSSNSLHVQPMGQPDYFKSASPQLFLQAEYPGSPPSVDSRRSDLNQQFLPISPPKPTIIQGNGIVDHGEAPRPTSVPSLEKPTAVLMPLDLAQVEEYLRKKLREAEKEHGEYASSWVSRANHLGQNDQIETFTDMVKLSETSPFASMKPIESSRWQSKSKLPKNQRLFAHCAVQENHQRQVEPSFAYPVKSFSAPAHVIPPFTHYLSSKRNILVEGDKQRTFLPYLGENTDELETDYQALELKIFQNQERHREVMTGEEFGSLWFSKIDAILSELGTSVVAVLRFLIDEDAKEPPQELPEKYRELFDGRKDWVSEAFYQAADDVEATRGEGIDETREPQKRWKVALQDLPQVGGRELAAGMIACSAFVTVVGFSLWHVVRLTPAAVRASRAPSRSPKGTPSKPLTAGPLAAYVDQACLVCKAHQCIGHGEFSDNDDGENVRIGMTSRSDLSNLPQSAMVYTPQDAGFLGRNADGSVSGASWTKLSEDPPGFDDNTDCSPFCFWNKVNRGRSSDPRRWPKRDLELLRSLVPAYRAQRRGACALSRMDVFSLSCSELFTAIISFSLPLHSELQTQQPDTEVHEHPYRHWRWWMDNSNTWKQHAREPFHPCKHEGKCAGNKDCSCDRQGISCEKSCHCPTQCSRRFRGCRCHARSKVCAQAEDCDCRILNRECDPDLCRTCGAHEVLDPANRYDEQIVKGRCANVYIQRAVPKRTVLGQSELLAAGGIVGWGLFMGEDTKRGDYIGEYIGEIVTPEESEQRGIIYHAMNMSYLFDLNSKQVLDSTPIGNKLRYINHQGDDFANCQAKVLLCGGVQRIGMFATKNIELGEELLFNYGEGFASKIDMVKVNKDGTVMLQKALGNQSPVQGTKARKTGHFAPADVSDSEVYAHRRTLPLHRRGRPSLETADDAEYLEDANDERASSASFIAGADEASADDEPAASSDDASALDEDSDSSASSSGAEVYRVTAKPAKPFKNVVLKSGMTGSDRMRKAWISRYRNMGNLQAAREQKKKFDAERSKRPRPKSAD